MMGEASVIWPDKRLAFGEEGKLIKGGILYSIYRR